MYVWVYECMGVQVYECMGVWVYECMGVQVYECMCTCVCPQALLEPLPTVGVTCTSTRWRQTWCSGEGGGGGGREGGREEEEGRDIRGKCVEAGDDYHSDLSRLLILMSRLKEHTARCKDRRRAGRGGGSGVKQSWPSHAALLLPRPTCDLLPWQLLP